MEWVTCRSISADSVSQMYSLQKQKIRNVQTLQLSWFEIGWRFCRIRCSSGLEFD